jgi:drug/metabolite transporter (DMT)-like permease
MYLRLGLAMLAFVGNSILCRLALKQTQIDAASFTLIRILGGAIVLALLMLLRGRFSRRSGSWAGGLALAVYATAFSFAYLHLEAGTGALLLFGAVQLCMIAWGAINGEKLALAHVLGIVLACCGVMVLLLPGASAPPMAYAALMILSGLAWGVYSLLGRGGEAPEQSTAGNFARALLMVGVFCLPMLPSMRWDAAGVTYAVISGGLASGVGYVLWYGAVRSLSRISAAVVQLSVPCLTGVAGYVFLDEVLTARLLLASAAVLGGIGLVLRAGQDRPARLASRKI